MAVQREKHIYSQQEYLELERKATTKSEFFKGEISTMSVASRRHVVITMNIQFLLTIKLKGKGCRPFNSDMRIHIPENGLYTYPDVSVVCGKEEFLDGEFDTLLNPILLFEILSSSTYDYDTGRKFELYRSIKSLKEYVTVSSIERSIQHYTKTSENTWV